jgi:activator of HSP90 ATPase
MKTKDLEYTVQFDASVRDVFEMIMDEKKHAEFTGSKVKIDRKEGGKFSMWDGGLYGTNLEIIPDRKIVQEWVAVEDNWPKGHVSVVTYEFSEKNGGTELKFLHTAIPEESFDGVESGWTEYYWENMKKWLEEKN